MVTNCSALCSPLISGPDAICDNGTFTAPLIAGANYTWTVNNTFLINANPTDNRLDITRRRDGSANITVTVQITSPGCGTATLSKTFQFGAFPAGIVGPYDVNQHTVMGVAYTNTPYYFIAVEDAVYFQGLNYTWTVFPPTGNPTLYSGNQPYMMFTEAGYHTLQLSKLSECGTVVSTVIVDVQENMSGFMILAYPNPVTSDNLNVSITQQNSELQALPTHVELFNFNNFTKAREWTLPASQLIGNFNLSGLGKGYYVLRVTKGAYKQSKLILVQ